MSGSASIRNSRMKFAKGVLSAFMAVVTVVGFTPIVPYHAYADESEPAQEQPAVQESNELQPATAEQVAPSAPADEQTPATGAVAATEEGTQLSAAGEGATSLEPMAGVSCIWNDTYYENVGAAVAAIKGDGSPTGGTITMIADSVEPDSITITEPISIDFAGKTVNLGHNTIYWDVEDSTFSLDGDGRIVAETVTAIHIQKGSFVLNGGSVKVTGLNDDAAAVLVDEGENNGIAILSGSIESEGGFAVATHADMLFTGGDISSLCVGGSAQAHMSGTGGMNQHKPAYVAGNPVIDSAGKGVVVEGKAEVHISSGAIVEAVADAVTVNGGSVEVAGSYVASEDGSALAAIGGIATVRDGAVLSTEDNGVVYAGDNAFVTVSSDGDNYTLLYSETGDMVTGNAANVVCNEGVHSTDKVVAAAIAEGFVCTCLQEPTVDTLGLWEINKTPNAPTLASEAVLPYVAGGQPIVDLNGAVVLGESESGIVKNAVTDAGYTLQYAKTVNFDAGSGMLVTEAQAEYRVIATLLDGFKWADGTDDVKVIEVAIVADVIDSPVAFDTLVFNGDPQSLIDFPEGTKFDSVSTTAGVTSIETNMGFQITFAEGAVDVDEQNAQLKGTNAGTYEITFALDDDENSVWNTGGNGAITDEDGFIAKQPVTVPTAVKNLAYTGKAQVIVNYGEGVTYKEGNFPTEPIVTSKGYTITAVSNDLALNDKNDIVATDAGTYTLTASLDKLNATHANYMWADDETTGPKTIDATIDRLGVPMPAAIGGLTYTGAPQPVINLHGGSVTDVTTTSDSSVAAIDAGYAISYPTTLNSVEAVVGGQIVATEAGTYEGLKAKPDSNHQWSDAEEGHETDEIDLTATIGKTVITAPSIVPETGTTVWTGEPKEIIDLNGAVILRATEAGGVITAETNAGYTLEYPITITYLDGKLYATDAGGYKVTATRESAESSIWSDDPEGSIVDPRPFEVTISKIPADKPTAVEHEPYTYDGTAKQLVDLKGAQIVSEEIVGDSVVAKMDAGYNLSYPTTASIVDGFVVATEVGDYHIIAELDGNHEWSAGDTANVEFDTSIAKGKVAVPEGIKDVEYTGEARVIANGDELYTLKPSDAAAAAGAVVDPAGNVSATNVGEYIISAALTEPEHYEWATPGTDVRDFAATIAKRAVEAPATTIVRDYVAGGQIAIAASDDYKITPGDPAPVITEEGAAKVENAGNYGAVLTLKDTEHTKWADGDEASFKTIGITVNPKAIAAPTAAEDLTYNREAQTMVAGGEGYKLTVGAGEPLDESVNATATDAGDYEITATLVSDNYVWEGAEPGVLQCTIDRYKVIKPKAAEGLVYNRAAQTLVKGGEGYTLGVYNGGLNLTGLPNPDAEFPEGKDATAIDAKKYTVIATLVDTKNYAWDDGLEAGMPEYDIKPVQLETEISAAPISEATVTASNMAYTGAPLEPAATVKIGDATLTYDTDYTVEYSNNKEVGTATITVTGKGNYTGTATGTFKIVESVPMFRLYNPNSGEHFYTKSTEERDNLKKVGWQYEGIGWYAPSSSNTPVYRLYNPNGGDHHYTVSVNERDMLTKAGWKYEGIGWYSDDAMGVKVLREYNPNATSGSHNFTTSETEHQNLVKLGWRDEGTAWYAVAVVS